MLIPPTFTTFTTSNDLSISSSSPFYFPSYFHSSFPSPLFLWASRFLDSDIKNISLLPPHTQTSSHRHPQTYKATRSPKHELLRKKNKQNRTSLKQKK